VKITLLPSTYYSDPTYNRILSSLRREFTASGHEVSIASRATAANPRLQLELSPDSPPCGGGGRRLPLLQVLAKLTPPGAVLNFHFSGWLRPWHAPLLLARRLAAVKLVVTFQDYLHPDLPPLTPAAKKDLLAILDRAHGVTAVSDFLARLLRRDFPAAARKLCVVPNGADRPDKAARSDAGRGCILTVGRQAPYKGLDLLLFAFAKAVEKGCGSKLLVCGAGARGPLERLAAKLGLANRVEFRGVVSPAAVSGLMKNCLFYATTPRWESFGMAALEAMAAGKAVLASKTGGLAEFTGRKRGTLAVAPQDTEAAAAAILKLSADGALRKALGREAARTALGYTWKKAADKYLRLAYR